jgi:hypothetical protein
VWDRIDSLLARAPHEEALRLHRVELLEARRRRAAGLDVGALANDETTALLRDLALVPVLTCVREACDGPLVLLKGAEVSLDYPGPRLRRFCDLDLLTDDAPKAQAALLAAGFRESRQEESRGVRHHLCPLRLPGLPLTVELHSAPNWADGLPAPSAAELMASALPGRIGVDGVGMLAPAEHAILLAAHAWSHDQLGRLGNLIDVAVTLQRADESEVAALARRWGCGRLWRVTRGAIGAVLEGTGRSAAVAAWARHLGDVRDRTVLEWHAKELLAPVWGLPRRRVPGAVLAQLRVTAVPTRVERWPTKLRRARLAVAHAGAPRSDHLLALTSRGFTSTDGPEAR